MTRSFHKTASSFARLSLVLAMALPLVACKEGASFSRGMESVHQPVVGKSSYVFDVQANGSNALTPSERARLAGWLEALNVGYGDQVALASGDNYISPALRDSVAEVLSRRGMLVDDDTTGIGGRAPYGAVRIVLRRTTASVPGCPDWSNNQETSMTGGSSSNYGCAINSNLATMVANPEDLVRGQQTDSILRTAQSNKAVKDYMTNGSKALAAGGN
jgi:pilus assembly protein CpaD